MARHGSPPTSTPPIPSRQEVDRRVELLRRQRQQFLTELPELEVPPELAADIARLPELFSAEKEAWRRVRWELDRQRPRQDRLRAVLRDVDRLDGEKQEIHTRAAAYAAEHSDDG